MFFTIRIIATGRCTTGINPANELFGFDRARTVSNQPAAAIVQQAQAFGQNDDITVLRIEFSGAASEALVTA